MADENYYWSLVPSWQHTQLLLSEFVAGSHVACAQYCIVCGRKNQLRVGVAPQDLASVQNIDKNAVPPVLGDHGTTMSGVYRHFNSLATPKVPASKLKYWGYKADGYSKTTVQSALAEAHGGGKFVIVEVGAAYKLPFNEKGVQVHYVLVVAYNSASGKVCVANGDRVPHSKTPDWYPLDRLMDGMPIALLTVQGLL